MSSIAESIMLNAWSRIDPDNSPALDAEEVKRARRTPVPKEKTPAVHLIDGDDIPRGGTAEAGCGVSRTKFLSIDVFVRNDGGAAEADPLVVEVHRRMDPDIGTSFPGVVRMGAIRVDEETADEDAVRVTLNYECDYKTSGWNLDA